MINERIKEVNSDFKNVYAPELYKKHGPPLKLFQINEKKDQSNVIDDQKTRAGLFALKSKIERGTV